MKWYDRAIAYLNGEQPGGVWTDDDIQNANKLRESMIKNGYNPTSPLDKERYYQLHWKYVKDKLEIER